MPNQKNNILGISVGTQLMGLALKNGIALEDWQVKNFEGVWSKRKLKIISLTVSRYIKEKNVQYVALKVPEDNKSSEAMKTLLKELQRVCVGQNVELLTCTINELKLCCGANNKEELMKYVLARHPELSQVFVKTQKVKKVYYVKIFEAVMASMLIS